MSSAPTSGEPTASAATGWASRPWAGWVVIVSRLVLATIYIMAAVPKLGDPATFARDIDNYRLLPVEWIAGLAVVLPPLELVVALALLTGIHARGAAVISAGMMAAFVGAMAQAIARDINIDCGCFGTAMAMEVSGWSILRNVVLASLSLPILYGPEILPRDLPSLFRARAA